MTAVQLHQAPVLDQLGARRRAKRIRQSLEVAVDELLQAWRDADYVALGYGEGQAGWQAYLDAEFGDLAFRLPAEARRERVLPLRQAGMSAEAIRLIPGMGSKGTVMGDLRFLRDAGRLADVDSVTSLDGRTRPARAASRTRPTPATVVDLQGTVADQAVAWVATAGETGLTVHELCDRAGWRQGKASAALSRVHRQRRVGAAAGFRNGCTVYVA